jgi:hypothetical protein
MARARHRGAGERGAMYKAMMMLYEIVPVELNVDSAVASLA